MPINVNKWKLTSNLETILELRPIALRNLRERAKFKIQEAIVRGFRDYLFTEGFTEVRTPKIVSRGAEGGANIFELEYFGKKAYLAQSPQFYKQIGVGVFERVFEIALFWMRKTPLFVPLTAGMERLRLRYDRGEPHGTAPLQAIAERYKTLQHQLQFLSDFWEVRMFFQK